jgi:hypothetical protein
MKVGLLTIPQKDSLVNQLYTNDSYFNPIQDSNADWIISTQEMDFCTVTEFLWVKTLPLIDWTGPYIPVSGSTEYVGS